MNFAETKFLSKTVCVRDGLFCPTLQGCRLSRRRNHEGKSLSQLFALCLPSGSREQRMPVSAHFLLFTKSTPPIHGLLPPPVKVGLPTSVSLIQVIPYRHAQRFVSWVTLLSCQVDRINQCSLLAHPVSIQTRAILVKLDGFLALLLSLVRVSLCQI